MGISGEDVEGSRHLGIDTGKRDQFFISAAQLVFPSYCLDQRCRGGCDQLQGIDWNGHRPARPTRSEEHTSELQSLMRRSYAVFCLKTKINYLNVKNSVSAETT